MHNLVLNMLKKSFTFSVEIGILIIINLKSIKNHDKNSSESTSSSFNLIFQDFLEEILCASSGKPILNPRK